MENDGKRRTFLKVLGLGSVTLGTAGYSVAIEIGKTEKNHTTG